MPCLNSHTILIEIQLSCIEVIEMMDLIHEISLIFRLLESWKEHTNSVSANHPGGNFELLIPMPIPHPVLICLLIYNRHRDVGAITLESESCRLLLRYIQGSTTLSSHTKE